MRRERRYRDSKCEFDKIRRHSRGQADQGEVLDNCCYMTFASKFLFQESRYYNYLFF